MDKSIHGDAYGALLALLREVRQEAGLRQIEVAGLIDEPQSFVSKYETGERRLDLIELRTICEALGTDLASFVGRLERQLH